LRGRFFVVKVENVSLEYSFSIPNTSPSLHSSPEWMLTSEHTLL
jgi:hypothetical protein